MLELPINKDCTGLEYNSHNLKKPAPIAIKGSVIPLSGYFSTDGYLDEDGVCVMEEDVEDAGLIFKKINGRGATKWTKTEIP